MRLLLANPNTSQAVTDGIATLAPATASLGTTIHAVTAARGVPHMATRAEACILGRAPLAGLAAGLTDQVAVPLVDDVAADVRQAEVLASMHLCQATAGSFRRPAAKPMEGVSSALTRPFQGSAA